MMHRSHAIWACCFLLLALTGCGRKTPVIPPQAVVPLPIEDLQYALDDKGATLSWTCPVRAEDGSRIEEVRTFAIMKSEVSFASFCPDCPIQYPLVITMSGEDVKPGSMLTYRDTDLKQRHQYTYKVLSRMGWKVVSRDSNRISFPWDSPLVAPVGLQIEVADQSLTVSWHSVSTRLDGTTPDIPVVYQLYRSDDGMTFEKIGDPLPGLTRVDTDVKNNSKYFYQIRAVVIVDGSVMPGEASEVISGMPRDLTPPAPPHKFTIAAGSEGVTILWENVDVRGIAGYRVYRRSADEKEYVLVGETPRNSFSFTDTTVPPGEETFFYAVTAFDDAVPPNESVFSREIEFRRKARPSF
ncbi:MAG: hypothetical protein V1706_17015 [Pseudomonadota bacterium]